MSTVQRAVEIALEAHKGQTDKRGQPYFLHPLRVMLSKHVVTDEERMIAVLHDVVEDCFDWSLDRLGKEFDEPVIVALDRLTRWSGESYPEFIGRIIESDNLAAVRVKLADLEDNMDRNRMPLKPDWTQEDFRRMAKYENARQELLRAHDRLTAKH